jgi:hypothetical protein
MLLQYNFQNSKIGQTKVNVIYSKNQTLSKVTIINGTRFRINYPYNLTNNLTSNVLIIQKIKFGEAQKYKTPVLISNVTADPQSLGLNIRKIRVMSQSIDNKKINEKNKEKNNFNRSSNNNNNNNNNNNAFNDQINNRRSNHSGSINLKLEKQNSYNNNLNNASDTGKNINLNSKDLEKYEADDYENFNLYSNKNRNSKNNNLPAALNSNSNVVSPILNMPINIIKSRILPLIANKNGSSSNLQKNSNGNFGANSNKDLLSSPGKIRMNFINKYRYNNDGNRVRPSLTGINQMQNEHNSNNHLNENVSENIRYEGSPNTKKIVIDNKNEKNLIMQNNPNMKVLLVGLSF